MNEAETQTDPLMVEHRIPVVFKAKGYAVVKLPLSASEEDYDAALEDFDLAELEDVDIPEDHYRYPWKEYWDPKLSKHLGVLPALAEVFQTLDDNHNIAAVASECCNGDSVARGEELLEEQPRYQGLVYIHSQNIENICEDGTFALGFMASNVGGILEPAEEESAHVAIAKLAQTALDAAGFTASWDGTSDSKIEVSGYDG